MEGALGPLLGQQRVGHRARLGPGPDLGQILLLHRVAPLIGELVQA